MKNLKIGITILFIGLTTLAQAQERQSKEKIEVTSSEMVSVNSIVRALKTRIPSYRGKFEVTPYGKTSLLLINVLAM